MVAELQRVILQAAPVRSRPTRLAKMERKLMLLSRKEKLSVIDMEQVKEVAVSCGISPNDDDVLEVLKFFHQKGTILYYILLQKLKCDSHTKLPPESCQVQFWYDSSGNLV